MKNFNFYLPTHLYFGIGEEKNVGKYLKENGATKVFFHYGKSSIKRNGLYQVVIESLKKENIEYYELGGVEPNPDVELVRLGVKLCKEKNIDFILAVGGGSVIDSAKLIAHGAFYEGDPYDFNLYLVSPRKSLPIGVILTLAASGSEMSASCVISDSSRGLKQGFNSETNRPRFAIENPELTYTVPQNHTAYGIVDILSHTFERYFNASSEMEFADYLALGLMKSVIDAGKKVLLEPDNYDARATLMVASSYSHNGLTGIGKFFSFPIHQLEHQVSALKRKVPHGGGLACLIPAWMKVVREKEKEKLYTFARIVMEQEDVGMEQTISNGIKALEDFITSFSISIRLRDYQITEQDIETMVSKLKNPVTGNVPLTHDLARKIYLLAL